MHPVKASILDSYADWQSSDRRACDCGSFNVEFAPDAANCVRCTAYRCEDCGAHWTEEE